MGTKEESSVGWGSCGPAFEGESRAVVEDGPTYIDRSGRHV